MQVYDVVIIGAGHNGLICAAYLLKAGYQVLVLERRSIIGGAATTEEIMPQEAPGFWFNRCAIDHEFIHLGPVVAELELERYGLEYLFCDPVVFCPHPNGQFFLGHRSLDRTCAEIERFSPRDALKYAEFTNFWLKIVRGMVPLFNAPPTSLLDIAGNYRLSQIKDVLSVAGSIDKGLNFLRLMLTSAEDILNEWFESEVLKAPLARLASELGMPPSQKNLAIGTMMMAMRHEPGMARPRGGTGALIQALLRLIKQAGGEVLADQPVKQVLVDDGRAIGVRVANGQEYRAKRGIISSLDAQRLFLHLMDGADVDAADPNLRDRLQHRIINNNESILKIDCALSEPLHFAHHQHRDEYLVGSVLIADSVRQVELAHSDPIAGRIPDADPSLYLVMPTLLDPSMAPAGHHTLWIEFFAPYQIAGAEGTGLYGTGWTEDLKERVADRVLDKLADYAPNLKRAILAKRVESPAELGERLGVLKGNYYHIDMTLEQMVFLRPLPELANYKTPIANLFLTGAGTHPGGSISGMPGRNTARVFLQHQQPIVHRLKETSHALQTGLRSLLGF